MCNARTQLKPIFYFAVFQNLQICLLFQVMVLWLLILRFISSSVRWYEIDIRMVRCSQIDKMLKRTSNTRRDIDRWNFFGEQLALGWNVDMDADAAAVLFNSCFANYCRWRIVHFKPNSVCCTAPIWMSHKWSSHTICTQFNNQKWFNLRLIELAVLAWLGCCLAFEAAAARK